MSRRTDYRQDVRDIVRTELAEYDAHTAKNVDAMLNAYHAKHVVPLVEWAALPWWRRIFRAP